MKVLLVTSRNKLSEKLAALNPELEYCAIVTDNVEAAKEVLSKFSLPRDLLHPMSELQKCLESLQYDYVLCVQDKFYGIALIRKLQSYDVPTEKVLSFAELHTTRNWQTERHLRYYQDHSHEIEMFATGISYTEAGIDIKEFKYKAINCATSSQDLYYGFQIAKSVVLSGGGVIKYVMRLLVLLLILFTLTFPKQFCINAAYCLILSLLTTCIISLSPLTFTKNSFAKNG